MKTMIDFFKTMFLMPKPWVAWVGLLMLVNIVGSLFFLETIEAKIILTALMAGAMIQTAIFRVKGFVRLLGIGHILWVPMVPWLWFQLGQSTPGTPFGYFLIAVMVVDTVSLIIDTTDVYRYLTGERAPTIKLKAG